jgi:hypothetical protein
MSGLLAALRMASMIRCAVVIPPAFCLKDREVVEGLGRLKKQHHRFGDVRQMGPFMADAAAARIGDDRYGLGQLSPIPYAKLALAPNRGAMRVPSGPKQPGFGWPRHRCLRWRLEQAQFGQPRQSFGLR